MYSPIKRIINDLDQRITISHVVFVAIPAAGIGRAGPEVVVDGAPVGEGPHALPTDVGAALRGDSYMTSEKQTTVLIGYVSDSEEGKMGSINTKKLLTSL